MNKIEELIQERCPNGVEWKTLGEVFKRVKGTPITATLMKEISSEDGDIKIFAGGKTVVNAHLKDIPNANIITTPAVLVQSRGVIDVIYYDKPFTFKNEMWAYLHDNKTTLKYLYYYLKKDVIGLREKATAMGAFPQISIPDTENIEIPIPPLAIQEEIVRILDTFTQHAAELQAELQARKEQYEYYRNTLLSFDEGAEGVEWKKLGEVCKCYAGATPNTKNKSYWENGTIPWMSSGEVNKGQIMETEKFITQLGYDNSSTKMIPENSVVIALAGQGKTRGTIAITRIPLCTNQSLCSLICNDTLLPDYLYYYLKGQYLTLRSISSGDGTRGGLNLKMISSFKILIPPLAEQQRIVDILDNFEALVNDLTKGLPAEIAARQEQYEYYRDKLLNFPRAD